MSVLKSILEQGREMEEFKRQNEAKAVEDSITRQREALKALFDDQLWEEIKGYISETIEMPDASHGRESPVVRLYVNLEDLRITPFYLWHENGINTALFSYHGIRPKVFNKDMQMGDFIYKQAQRFPEYLRETHATEIQRAKDTLRPHDIYFGKTVEDLVAARDLLLNFYSDPSGSQVDIEAIYQDAITALEEQRSKKEAARKLAVLKQLADSRREAELDRLERDFKIALDRQMEQIEKVMKPAWAAINDFISALDLPENLAKIRYSSGYLSDEIEGVWFEDWLESHDPNADGYYRVIRKGKIHLIKFPHVILIEKDIVFWPARDWDVELCMQAISELLPSLPVQFYSVNWDPEVVKKEFESLLPLDKLPAPLPWPQIPNEIVWDLIRGAIDKYGYEIPPGWIVERG
jgi:hypothetical protein